LTWEQTWFGRTLSDAQMQRYLQDERHPRNMQHALSQVSDRILRGDAKVREWYPRVAALAHHPAISIRSTAAWVMGQDNTSDLFHQTLLEQLKDPDLMVRRNAALSLVRFQDSNGRLELLGILGDYAVRAPVEGTVSAAVHAGQKVGPGTLLARVTAASGQPVDVRALFAGVVAAVSARDGSKVEPGQQIASLESGSDQVWEALRALYLIGVPEDSPLVERYAHGVSEMPDFVRRQATLTAQAIRVRSERSSSR
jgi:acetyl/propionyl-CoA carboxylase alpha subunit